MDKVKEEKDKEINEKSKENDSQLPDEILDEILDDVPDEHKKSVEKMLMLSVQRMGMVAPESAVMKKISEEHISKYLDGAREEMEKTMKKESIGRFSHL